MADIDQVIAERAAMGKDMLTAGANYIKEAISAAEDFEVAGFSWSSVDVGNYLFSKPANESINVKYVAPTQSIAAVNLEAIDRIDALALPASYVINANGLFSQATPEMKTGVFSVTSPDVNFSEIDRQLASLSVPDIEAITMPTMSNITVGATPTLAIPKFTPATAVGELVDPVNQQLNYSAEYDRLRPSIKAFIDAGVDEWITQYAPEYRSAVSQIEKKLSETIESGRMLRPDYQTYLKASSSAEIEAGYAAALSAISNDRKRSGFAILPPSVTSARNKALQSRLNNLATQSVAREIRLIEMEVDNIKWAVGLSVNLRQNLLQSFMGYAGTLAQVNEQSSAQAQFSAGLYATWYEQAYKQLSLKLDTLKAEASIYETELKSALAMLDGYRLELDAKKITLEIDSVKLDFVTKQSALQLAKVQIYTQLVGSVDARARLEIDKVELFGKQVEAYNSQLTGDKLRNDIYVAGLSGDELKLKAEMSKLEAWEKTTDTLIKGKQLEHAQQSLGIDRNKLIIAKYEADLKGFNNELLANGQAFDNDLKGKMANLDAYKFNLSVNVENNKLRYDKDRLLVDQSQYSAKQRTDGMRIQAAAYNQHYEFLGNLTAKIGEMYTNTASGILNAQVTAITQSSQS